MVFKSIGVVDQGKCYLQYCFRLMTRSTTWKLTKAYKLLIQNGFSEKECRLIGDALFLVYHPTSDFYERSITEKKTIASEEFLGKIDWGTFQEAEDAYKELVLPREIRIYNSLSHLMDYTLNACEKVRETPAALTKINLSRDLLKEITLFCSKYTTLKEDLRKQRQQ